MSAAKALRLALSRCAEDEAGLALSVLDFAELRVPLAGIPAELPAFGLTGLLRAPDGALGLVALDHAVLAALVEQLTTGAVRHGKPEERAATATDAALASALIDGMLERFEAMVAELSSPPDVAGYRFLRPVTDPRAIGLTLEDTRYRFYRLTLDLGQGARTGDLLLILPLHRESAGDTGPVGSSGAAGGRADLAEAVRGAPVVMQAVLHRQDMALETVMALKPGDVIPVPRAAIRQVAIEGLDGRAVARARLGQANGHRALRLIAASDVADTDRSVASPAWSPQDAPPRLGPEARPEAGVKAGAGSGPEAGAGGPEAPPSSTDPGAGPAPPPSEPFGAPLDDLPPLPPLAAQPEGELPPLDTDLPPLPPLSGMGLPPLGA